MMAEVRDQQVSKTEFIEIAPDERVRESDLRERFANFWATAKGDQRKIYDTFISGSPLTDSVTVDEVAENGVRGFFIRPQHAAPGRAILFLHGGGYVLGSAKAYRGLVSQIVRFQPSSSTIRSHPKRRGRAPRMPRVPPGNSWLAKASIALRSSATPRAVVYRW
jgi:hypothetical protein